MTSYPFIKMAAATAKYYFRSRICWCHCLQKVKVYQQTRFRGDISIGGWDITTSGFEIQMSAILEFYFRFRPRPVRCNLHIILYQATEFRPNRSTHCGYMTSYLFLKMAAVTAKYYFRFRICCCHCLQKVKIYQHTKISSRYLNWRLRYNYFRFRNTNVRHIGIVLPVSISTISPFCIRLPNFDQIGTPAAEIWRNIDFQDGSRQPCCIYFGVMADHPRSAICGLNSDLK